MEMVKKTYKVAQDSEGQRLDNFLIKYDRKLPKSLLYKLIRKKAVLVNQKRTKHDYRLCVGDTVSVPMDLYQDVSKQRSTCKKLVDNLDVIWEDAEYIIINKPSGLAVHAGTGITNNLIDAITDKKAETGESIYLAHRLDRKTSGCILLAKTRAALLSLHEQLQTHQLKKNYVALASGKWLEKSSSALWEHPLLRVSTKASQRAVVVDEDGKSSCTKVTLTNSTKSMQMLSLKPITGRMHQLRVHCAYAGLPIIGDEIYGNHKVNRSFFDSNPSKPMLLHAQSIEFYHASKQVVVSVRAPLPDYFKTLLQQF